MPPPAVLPSPFFFTRRVSVLRYASLHDDDPDDFPQDDAAGRADSLTAVPGLTDLPCSVQPEAGRPGQVYGQRKLEVDTCLYFRRALDVRADDVVVDDVSAARYVVLAAGDEAEQGRVSWVLARRLL